MDAILVLCQSVIELERQYYKYQGQPNYRRLCEDTLNGLVTDATNALSKHANMPPNEKAWFEQKIAWAQEQLANKCRSA
jgi:hypothetical protein